uniref:TSA: Wollemia nobilis Ref_Wollemi_Transcript_67_1762 transcribed RNA sequence n=1 Tax=Wollemia nobilis TaxID=56998 RepID=A0A0C9RZG2_9CONI
MMTKMSSMSPEGFLMAGGLSKDRRLMAGASARMEMLLGNFPQHITSSSSSNFTDASGDLNELKEEDVWGTWQDGGGSNPAHDTAEKEAESFRHKTDYPVVAAAAAAAAGTEQVGRVVQNGRPRWLGFETGGLSVAFEESNSRSRFSPLTRTSNNFKVGGASPSPSRSMSVRLIPQSSSSSLAEENGNGRHMMHQSAPVNIPDWSKILGMDHRKDQSVHLHAAGDEEEEEEEGDKLPPHEYLAREQARSQMTTTSVFEGVGRTLKGRDMSRVRNTVWRQTGFLG